MTEAIITILDGQSNSPEKTLKIVQITGQLDESNIDEKIKVVYKIMEEHPKNLDLIFDLENLDYMNSKSIGYLTDIYGKTTENGGRIAITKAKANITDILQVVGLTQLINMYATMEEAQNSLGGTGQMTTTQVTEIQTPAPLEAPAMSAPIMPTEAVTPAPTIEAAPIAPAETVMPTPAQEPVPTPIEAVMPMPIPEPVPTPVEAVIPTPTIEAAPIAPVETIMPTPAPLEVTIMPEPTTTPAPTAEPTPAQEPTATAEEGTYKFENQ